jgi:hypothetical protein
MNFVRLKYRFIVEMKFNSDIVPYKFIPCIIILPYIFILIPSKNIVLQHSVTLIYRSYKFTSILMQLYLQLFFYLTTKVKR